MKSDQNQKIDCITGGLKSRPDQQSGGILGLSDLHPCYSEDAAGRYARIHLPVAPECNISCNYCNRKFDCANESRPGVSSSIITPEEGLQKVIKFKKQINQLTVAGIAGPGDPLANPENTFNTFNLIRHYFPKMLLCLSTNGLLIPSYTKIIKSLGVSHVTVTINAVDSEIGKNIYSHIKLDGKKYTGFEGAAILIERQLESVRLLKEENILCKVNSVLIPGINDKHLHEVSKAIKKAGCVLHNITPMIPVEGSFFIKTGIGRPSIDDVETVRAACGNDMNMMRHCKQCRADAVGFINKIDSAISETSEIEEGEGFTKQNLTRRKICVR